MTPVSDSVLTTLDLYGSLELETLYKIERHHGHEPEVVHEAICDLIKADKAKLDGTVITLLDVVRRAIPPVYLAKADAYRKAKEQKPTIRERFNAFIALLWHRCWGGILVFIATSFLALGLCAVEIPDGIIRGIVMVETGATWHNIGDITGGWSKGEAGEISHFQLSDDALREMKATDKAARIRSDSVLAESYARAFLIICYDKRGNWRDAVATYHRWSRYRSASARDYADRVLSIAKL